MRSRLVAATSIALILCAAPAAVYAAGLKNLFRTRARSTEIRDVRAPEVKDARITVQLSNRSGIVQQVKVGDHSYTLMPNGALGITAPQGTDVIAGTVGLKHRVGDKLCSLTPDMNLETVVIH